MMKPGIDAMQPMEKALDSDRHYLLPLPAGLHAESAELFGFFTYEFRLGHAKIWSTAQGRFGRPLRATGIQHPAPTLTCIVNRDEEKVYVTAPYAVTVHDGKNVTAVPPRTELWCLLYAQVKQADNEDFRNVLLDDKVLDPNVQVRYDGLVDLAGPTDDAQRIALQRAVIKTGRSGLIPESWHSSIRWPTQARSTRTRPDTARSSGATPKSINCLPSTACRRTPH